MTERQRVSTEAKWAATAGYSRAVRVGRHIYVSGTAPVGENGKIVHKGDPYLQARRCLEIIEAALREAGGGLEHVVRTRMFAANDVPWEEVGRAHGEVFREVRPATTLVHVAGFVHPDIMVEIEADAVL